MRDLLSVIQPLIPRLRRYARSMAGDAATADDLVQDCLERAVRGWPKRRPDGDARAWVFAILHNLAVNRLRQAARRGVHVALEGSADPALASPPAQEDALRHADLLRALDTLPLDQRSVLLLVSVEGLSYEQAARVLDIPIGTVMSRLSRARQKLLLALDADQSLPCSRRVK
jgi:RNA polymerase sigma-70 factor (ECF subfamily)